MSERRSTERITTREAATRLGRSEATVRTLFRRGELTGSRRRQGPWSRIYIDAASVDEYLALRPRPGTRRRGPSAATLARARAHGIVGSLDST